MTAQEADSRAMARITGLIQIVLIGLLLVACTGGAERATEAETGSTPLLIVPDASASAPSEAPTVMLTAVPTVRPTMAPTAAPAQTETAMELGPPVERLDCGSGESLTRTREGMTVAVCLVPRKPVMGRQTSFTILVATEAGLAVVNATVSLMLTAGMAGMLGEHDEDFSLELADMGMGVYQAESAVGPADLILTNIYVRVRQAGQMWTFQFSADELSSP